jgi:hypothetical protein
LYRLFAIKKGLIDPGEADEAQDATISCRSNIACRINRVTLPNTAEIDRPKLPILLPWGTLMLKCSNLNRAIEIDKPKLPPIRQVDGRQAYIIFKDTDHVRSEKG